eukprot:TRINITY_DN6896_c0_g3_i1.p1 TRINITY_DN6896_c0_g3~~TRINITY_DN6896_c0_g3_i1.p1  ORF type:complete len:589 (+),score=195.87 TRINITY_DN6896_c0_g3_i1:108-1769(+)
MESPDFEQPQPSLCSWPKYRRAQCIGAGSFGQVYLVDGVPDEGGPPGRYVIKSVHIRDLPDHELRTAVNEVQVLSLLQHANVVRYIDHFPDSDGFLNIVMEYCPGGDLAQLIDKKKELGDPFTEPQVGFMAFQLLQAMKYIHSINIIHRDLKPANIFLTKDHTLKIADFGISKLVGGSSVAQTVVGTPFYLSPEICENRPYNHSTDVWSAGCVIYEIAALEKAFSGSNILAVVRKVTEGRYLRLPFRYRKVTGLLGRMLVVNAQDRATVCDLITEFFTGGIAALPTARLEKCAGGAAASEGEGLAADSVELTYVQWGSELQSKSREGRRGGEGRSQDRAARLRRSSSKGGTGSSGKKRRPHKGKATQRTGVTEARMPELEFHLLPSQKCLLLGEEEEGQREKVVFRRDRALRPVERSGRRPSDSFAATGSGELVDAARAAAAAGGAPPPRFSSGGGEEDDDEYRDDFEREHDDGGGYSDESFERYEHPGESGDQERDEAGRDASPIRLSDADVENIRRALEIDQTTTRQTREVQLRHSELCSQQHSPLAGSRP